MLTYAISLFLASATFAQICLGICLLRKDHGGKR